MLLTINRQSCTITDKAPTRAFSWLKAAPVPHDNNCVGVNTGLAKCLNSVLNVKELVSAFNQQKALEGAFSVIVKTDCETMEHYTALTIIEPPDTGPTAAYALSTQGE